MTFERYRRKPVPEARYDLTAVRWDPGAEWDTLRRLACRADPDATATPVSLPHGTVLLIRWTDRDGHGCAHQEYLVIEPGDYLTWGSYGLATSSRAELDRIYDRQEA